MRKRKLDLATLQVDSFELLPRHDRSGTVHAYITELIDCGDTLDGCDPYGTPGCTCPCTHSNPCASNDLACSCVCTYSDPCGTRMAECTTPCTQNDTCNPTRCGASGCPCWYWNPPV